MTRVDTLKNGCKIIQDDKGFCFGVDALLLCAFSRIKLGQKAIDLGSGNGIIPIVMKKKSEALRSSHVKEECHFTGLEIQGTAAELAKKSVKLNGFEKSVSIVQGDIRNVKNLFEAQSFDAVFSNPPYMKVQGSKESLGQEKRIARHEILCGVEDIAAAASYLLKPNGTFFMIHRPFRLQEIFEALSANKMAVRRARLVHPFFDKAPEMILLEAKKNYKKDLKFEPPLVMYEGREYSKNFLDYCGL